MLDDVLEDHEFTANEVAPNKRQKLPKTVELELEESRTSRAVRRQLIEDRHLALTGRR